MGRILIKSPSYPTPVNTQHKYAQGLKYFGWIGPGYILNLADNRTLFNVSATDDGSWLPVNTGYGRQHTNPVNKVVITNNSSLILPTGPLTLIFRYQKTDATNRNSNCYGTETTSSARLSSYLPWGNGTVYFDVSGTGEGSSRLSVAGLTLGDDVWCQSVGPRGMEIWQNYIKVASNAANPARTSTTVPFSFGKVTSLSNGDLAIWKWFLIYEGQLSEQAIIDISNNPWQMLRQRNSVTFLPVVAVGGVGKARIIFLSGEING